MLSAPRLLITLCGVVGLLWPGDGLAQEPGPLPVEFHHDFRGRPLPPELSWFNAEEGKYFHQEADGLHIAIPDTWIHPWGGIGFRTSFGFGGDFEVTLAFEILNADTPPQGYGVGVCLYLAKPGGGASLCRLRRKGGSEVLLWDQAFEVEGKKSPKVIEGLVPRADKIGRLRLRRCGTTLQYLWAPGLEGGAFEQVHQVDFGDGPIDRVRLAAVTGRQPCNLDLRLIDFQIHSQTSERSTPVAAASAAAPPRAWRIWGVGALVVAIAIGATLAVRHGRRQPTMRSNSD